MDTPLGSKWMTRNWISITLRSWIMGRRRHVGLRPKLGRRVEFVSFNYCPLTADLDHNVLQRFTVNWSSLTPHSTTLSGFVTVDGIRCGGKIMYPSSKAKNIKKSGFSTSSTTIRPFAFAPLQLTGMLCIWSQFFDSGYIDSLDSRWWFCLGLFSVEGSWWNLHYNLEG